MKSLYSCIRESIFDNEDVISKETDKVLKVNILDKILKAKSFKEYEQQITNLKDLLEKEIGSISKGGKRVRFEKQGVYLIILHRDSNLIYQQKEGTLEHSGVYIGASYDNVTYLIQAVERQFGRRDCIENGSGYKGIKFYYKNLYTAINSWMSADLYVYKINDTDYEGMLDYMKSLKPYDMNLI